LLGSWRVRQCSARRREGRSADGPIRHGRACPGHPRPWTHQTFASERTCRNRRDRWPLPATSQTTAVVFSAGSAWMAKPGHDRKGLEPDDPGELARAFTRMTPHKRDRSRAHAGSGMNSSRSSGGRSNWPRPQSPFRQDLLAAGAVRPDSMRPTRVFRPISARPGS
jgi:hypothetical protein